MTDYRRETDSAGVTVEYRPLSALKGGERIASGWRPWPMITLIEDQADTRRVFYDLNEHPTPWFPLDQNFPVVVFDPEALADEAEGGYELSQITPKLQINPEPLKVVDTPRCAVCRRHAPNCSCGKAEYEWPDGSKA